MKVRRTKMARSLLASLLLVGLALGIAACGGAGSAPPADPDSPKGRVSSLEDDTDRANATIVAFNEAFDARDGDGLTALFTPTAEVYLPDGGVVRGRDLARHLAPEWAAWSNLETRWKLVEIKLSRPYGWAIYTEDFSFDAAGSRQSVSNLVTMTFERQGARWLIAHLHLSPAASPD